MEKNNRGENWEVRPDGGLWYIHNKNTTQYLYNDGKVRYWMEQRMKNVHFDTETQALRTLHRYLTKGEPSPTYQIKLNEKDKELLFTALDKYAESIQVFKGRVKGTAAKLSRLERIKAIVRSGVKL